jgi:poly(A) polymerase
MMRAARFIAGYGLAPEPELVDAVRQLHERLRIVSPERIRDELDKLVTVEHPTDGLWFLCDTGLAGEFLPELPALALEQDPVHRHKDVLAHTIAVVERARPDRLLRLAALLHDIGKPATRRIGSDGVSFHHHEVVGARMARDRMRALRYPNDDVDVVSRLVELHLRFHTYRMGWTRADCTTRSAAKAKALSRRMDELERRLEELRAQEELDAIRPDLDGHQIMEQLHLAPGPEVGEAHDYLLELRLDEGPLGEAEARRRLSRWWKERSREAH